MRANLAQIATAIVLALASPVALADDSDPQPPTPAPSAAPPPPSSAGSVGQTDQATVAVNIPPPAVSAGITPAGQWVYTAQYGWLWMPTDRSYTYAPRDVGGDPYMYVYYPSWGWRWLAAPWIFGIGPRPYFGVVGWHHYGWYGHPWFGHAWYGWRSGYPSWYRGVAYVHPGYVGPHWGGGAPVVVRPGYGAHPARVWHGRGWRH